MAFEIPLSKIEQFGGREKFDLAVAGHIANMQAFTKTKGKPRPMTSALVELALKRITYPVTMKKPDEYVSDYIVVDDTPPPPPPLNLADRKSQLTATLHIAENAALENILPFRKRRLASIEVNTAFQKNEEDRTDADKEVIASYNSMQERMSAVVLMAAQAESDIEDLTDDNINSWQPPNFG